MAEVVRTFKIPEHLSDESVSQLTSNFRALPDRQKKLAQSTPSVAVAREVAVHGRTIKIHYECEQVDTAADAISGKRADSETLLDWAGQLCQAFMAAYPMGESPMLRHGGFCPAAVMIAPSGSLRVLDFGVAECFAAVPGAADESWLMQVAGSVAPEVWNAPGRFGEQSDIFALGVMLYELATGKHPFGAIRSDPEDCKYQILVELPVPPHQRRRELSEPLSQFIYRAVRSQPEKRYSGFAEMFQALTSCRQQLADQTLPSGEPQALACSDDLSRVAATQSVDPRGLKARGSLQNELPATAPEEDEQQRREYLAEQALLKQERQEAKRRQDQRQQRARQTRAKIRRHALALMVSVVVLVVVSGSAFVMVRRSQNAQRVEEFLDRTNQELVEKFSVSRTDEVAALLGIATPSAGLSRALADLRKVAPDSAPALRVEEFTNLMRSSGLGAVVIGEDQLALDFRSEGGGSTTDTTRRGEAHTAEVNLQLTDANLERFVAGLVDRLAGAQLDDTARAFIDRLRNIVTASQSVSEVEAAFIKLLEPTSGSLPAATSHVLGYLGYQGKAKTLSLGRFEPVPGESAVRSAAILMGRDGRAVPNVDPQLIFQLDCRAESSPCELARITVQPAEEPAAHRQWCIELVMHAIAEAFRHRDVATVAELTGQSQLGQIEKTIAWAQQCKSADLVFEQVDYESAVALATVKYRPGLLANSENEHTTQMMQIGFSAARDWGVRPSLRINWPGRPTILRRQQLGAELLAKLDQAWGQQDPEPYLQLFEGCIRSAEAVAGMFRQMTQSNVEVQFRAIEDQDSEVVLFVEAATNQTDSYAPKRFAFVLEKDRLRWDPSSADPLWIVAGDKFQEFVRRLRESDWEQIGSIEADLQNTPAGDLSSEERKGLRQWLTAIHAAKEFFEPQSGDFSHGFARRAVLRGSSGVSMPFHVVFLPGARSNVVYLLEREVQIADIAMHWSSSDRPWEQWQAIVGSPPADQVVGITLSQARKLAADLGCEVPLLAEWQSAAGNIPAAAEMGFGGGVWEFVSDATDDGIPLIVGGCWYDDNEAWADLDSGPPAPLRRQSRFGTIGFRVCKRFAIPEQALLGFPSAAGS